MVLFTSGIGLWATAWTLWMVTAGFTIRLEEGGAGAGPRRGLYSLAGSFLVPTVTWPGSSSNPARPSYGTLDLQQGMQALAQALAGSKACAGRGHATAANCVTCQ